MSRRSLFFAVGILACLVCGVVGVLAALVRCEPEWYRGAALAPGPQRKQYSKDFYDAFLDLKSQIDNEKEWSRNFEAQSVNAWFEEGLFEMKLDADLSRSKIREQKSTR